MENLRTGKTELGLLPFNDLNRFKNFIKNHWDENHIFVVDSIVFNLQHKGATNYHYLIAKLDGEIIGAHGVIPLNHFDQKLPNNQIFIALWRVVENKGIGIGLRIFQEILKIYNPTFIAGLPMNSKVTKFYNRFGFECKTMSHHVMLSQKKKISLLRMFLKILVRKVPLLLVMQISKNYLQIVLKKLIQNTFTIIKLQ